jgi:DNA-binding MarR family transcriptional regulator
MVKDIREGPDPTPEPSGTPSVRPMVVQVDASMRALHTAVERFIDAAAQRYGVNRNDQRCLELLDRRGPLTAGQLAEAAGLSAAAVTKVVDRLLDAGYVRRIRSESDRRQVIIATTDAEQRLAREIFGPLVMDGYRLLAELTDDQLQILDDVVQRATDLNIAHATRVRQEREPDRL